MRMDRHIDHLITLPEVAVRRGGITFRTSTQQEQAAAESRSALIKRHIDACARLRHHTINATVAYASLNGMDVHITEPPRLLSLFQATDRDLDRLAYVGIEFTPAEYSVPVIHYHQPYEDEFAAEMAWEAADVEHWLDISD
jgi:hypothetical protein